MMTKTTQKPAKKILKKKRTTSIWTDEDKEPSPTTSDTLNSNMIPEGGYCYSEKSNCPYYDYKTIGKVKVPYCKYLKQGGTDHNWTEEEWSILENHFGTDENIYEQLPLPDLWDKCKYCGINEPDQEVGIYSHHDHGGKGG